MNDVLVSCRKEPTPVSSLNHRRGKRFALVAGLLSMVVTGAVHAVPYATGLGNNAGTISFRLNESADSVKIVSNGGATTNDLGALGAGAHSFPLGIAGTFQVVVFKVSAPGFVTPIAPNRAATLQINTDSTSLRFNNPRGIAVNKNPASPYFGRVYISNTSVTNSPRPIGDGIYVFNSDLTDAVGQGDAARTGGLDFSSDALASPYRLTVGADDKLYIADYSTAAASLYVTDADVSPGTGLNVLGGPAGGPFPVTTARFHGSIAAAVVEGSLSGGNLTAYVVDEDLQTDPASTTSTMRQTLWRHDIGGSLPGPSVMPTQIALHQNSFLRTVGAQTMDMTRGTNGNFYLSNYRSTGTEAGLWVLDSVGTVLWNSLSESRTFTGVLGTNDLLRATGGLDVSPRGDFMAIINIESNGITVLPLINGLPDITNRMALGAFNTTTGQGREVAFDLAGNLYAASSGAGMLRSFSPGGTTTAITGSDGTFEMIRPSGVSAFATDPLANETAGDTATFTISRDGDTAQDLTVLYTISGTATNGTDYTTIPASVVIPAGSPSVDITIAPIDDSSAEFVENVAIQLVGTAQYDLKTPVFATAYIADDEEAVVNIVGVDTNAYEPFPSDKLTFQVQRLGTTNTELFVLFDTIAGTAQIDSDYQIDGAPLTFRILAGEVNISVGVEPRDDITYEGNETVGITLVPSFDYTVGTSHTAFGLIRDNEWAPATVLFSDDFDINSSANWTTRFGANNGVLDARTDFAYDYSAYGIPAAPHSAGTTLGLVVTVNKDATLSSAGINLYPTGQSFKGNHILRFDMFMSIGASNATEHALAGINHSGLFTNRVSQTPANHVSTIGTDGIWFGIEAAAGNSRDYGVYTSTNPGTLPGLIATRAATAVAGLVTRPPYSFAGSPGSASNSTTKAWSSVEVAQNNNVVTLKVNSATILQVTNTYGFYSGNVMIGYNDQFESRGSDLSFVVFDNVQVVSTDIQVVNFQVAGNQVQIDFIGVGDASEYKVEAIADLNNAPAGWGEIPATIAPRVDGPGFRATFAKVGDIRFFRIKR